MSNQEKKDIGEIIGKNVKLFRNKKGVTQGEIQREINCSDTYVSKLENGKMVPSIEKLIKICNSVDASMNDVFEYSKDSVKWKEEEQYEFLRRYPPHVIFETLKIMIPMKEAYISYQKEKKAKSEVGNMEVAEEINYCTIGKKIEEQRIRTGKSLKKISNDVGIDERTFRKIEKNQAIVSPYVYMQIGEEIHMSLDRMFSDAINNKDVIIQEYIEEMFGDIGERDKMIFKEIFQVTCTILMAHEDDVKADVK